LKTLGFSGKAARLISFFGNAPLVSILVFILINYVLSGPMFVLLTVISIIFAAAIPVATVLVWSWKTKKIELDIPEKGDRPLLLVCVIMSYGIGAIILYYLHAPWLVFGLMLCYCTNTLVVFIITLFWKISIHAMGVTGPATALAFANVLPGFILGVLVLPVMWSRVHLRRHTIAQVLAGAFLGVSLTAIQLFLLRQLYGG
jgi:membrane-associated phospholipid phosphatase